MERQLLATVVVFLFCLLYTAAIAAQTKVAAENAEIVSEPIAEPAVSATRTFVQHLGFGKRVDVKLKNGSKANGRITALAADRFVVTDSKGVACSIDYADVSRITKQKEKLGIFHKPWVGIMFTAAGVGTLIVLALQFFD
jgi:hypothetical protein